MDESQIDNVNTPCVKGEWSQKSNESPSSTTSFHLHRIQIYFQMRSEPPHLLSEAKMNSYVSNLDSMSFPLLVSLYYTHTCQPKIKFTPPPASTTSTTATKHNSRQRDKRNQDTVHISVCRSTQMISIHRHP